MTAFSTRAFIAATLGVLLALWVLRPTCPGATAGLPLPEFGAVTSVPAVVI